MVGIVASIITEVTDWLDTFSATPWFLLIIFSVALLDSVFPVVPGETTVIAGGVAAGAGNQTLAFVILAGAVGGAVIGASPVAGAVIGGAVGAAAGAITDRDDIDLGRPIWR